MVTLTLTRPDAIGSAVAPSPWLSLALSGRVVSLIAGMDRIIGLAVGQERCTQPTPGTVVSETQETPSTVLTSSPATGERFERDRSTTRTAFVPSVQKDDGREAEGRRALDDEDGAASLTSTARAALAFHTVEREAALNDADNQEGGYLPCVNGDELSAGKYTLVRELGRGESSKVWLAKLVPPTLTQQHSDHVMRPRPDNEDSEDLRGRASPLKGTTDPARLVAVKIYRCEDRLRDSMEYERSLMAFVGRRCAHILGHKRAVADAVEPGTPRRNNKSSPNLPSSPKSARKPAARAVDADRSIDSSVASSRTTSFVRQRTISPSSAARHFGICGLRDDFVHSGPHGTHPCLVFDVLGPPVDWLMKEFDFQGIPFKPVIVDIVRSTLRTLEVLESLHVVHTDLKPENLLFVRPQPDLSDALDRIVDGDVPRDLSPEDLESSMDLEARQDAAFGVRFIDFGLSYIIPPALRTSVTVRPGTGSPTSRSTTHVPRVTPEEAELLHLGNYQKGAVIQTREYRAPEIVLGMNFNSKADIWSLGCMVFELVTGQFLFDPKSHADSIDESAMDVRHLFEMSTLLGPPPTSWLDRSRGQYTSNFFDVRTWRFMGPRPLRTKPSKDLVAELMPFVVRFAPADQCRREAQELADFILRCVQWDPSKRSTASELLLHPWLSSLSAKYAAIELIGA
jgi:serine/threonine protein kinase